MHMYALFMPKVHSYGVTIASKYTDLSVFILKFKHKLTDKFSKNHKILYIFKIVLKILKNGTEKYENNLHVTTV